MKTNIHQALTAVAIALLTGSALTADVVNISQLTTTAWVQEQPYNDFAPMRDSTLTNNFYRGRSATGCTAISFAQVLNYWQWPALINKSNTVEHQLRKSSTELETYVGTTTIRFNGWTPFDYALLDEYPQKYDIETEDKIVYNYDLRGTLAEKVRFPVARLTLFVDSLAQTLFGSLTKEEGATMVTAGGSGAFVETVLPQLEEWYEPTTKYTITDDNRATVANAIEADLKNGMPVILVLAGQNGSHAIYAHSWKRDESGNITIGVNLGWGGAISEKEFSNTYFYQAWTGLKPKKMTQVVPLPKIVSGTATLNWYFPNCHADAVQSFKITAQTGTGSAVTLAEGIDKTLRTKEVDLTGLTAGKEYIFAVTPVFADTDGVVAGTTVAKVVAASEAVQGLPTIQSVTGDVSKTAGGTYSVVDGFFRECAAGKNVLTVTCSKETTKLYAYPSHVSQVLDGATVYSTDVKVYRTERGETAQFDVVVDVTGIPNRSRMILTLEAQNDDGTTVYKDMSLRFSDEVVEQEYTPADGAEEIVPPVEEVRDERIVAMFADFGVASDSGYSIDTTDSTLNDDKSITIGSAKPLTITGAGWSSADGISVLLKYKSLATDVSDRTLIAFNDSSYGTRAGMLVATDGNAYGVEQGGSKHSNGYNDTTRAAVSTSGYLLLCATTSGLNAYDAEGNTIYSTTGVKVSGTVGDKTYIGGSYTYRSGSVSPDLLATGMVVEGVTVYKGALATTDIAQAVADLDAYIAKVAPKGDGGEGEGGETPDPDPEPELSTADPAKWVWIGGVGSADAPGDWATTANWEWRDANNVKTVSQPAESHYPSKNNTNNNAWLPIEIEGSSATPVYVKASSANQVEGWKLRIALSYAHVTIENLGKLQSETYIHLTNSSTLIVSDAKKNAYQWEMSDMNIGDGCVFAIHENVVNAIVNPWSVNLNKTGRLEFVSWTRAAANIQVSCDLNLLTTTSSAKKVYVRELGSWSGSSANNLNMTVGVVTGGVGTDTDALTLAAEDLSAYPVGTYNFVKDTDAKKYLVYYVDYSNPGETDLGTPTIVGNDKPPATVLCEPLCMGIDWNQDDSTKVGQYFCGCDPLAWGQVLTYHALINGHPQAGWMATAAAQNWVTLDGGEPIARATILTPPYDWEKIKNKDGEIITTQGTVSLSHVQRLMWDLGVLGGASYKSGGTGGTAFQEGGVLVTEYFGYESVGYAYGFITTEPKAERVARLRKLLRVSLQAGAPLVTDIVNHVVVVDGWGVDENGDEWFHFDMGWGDDSGKWRNVPALIQNETYGLVQTDVGRVITLAHPETLGSVVVGRVVDEAGVPVVGATVKLVADNTAVYTATTDAKGLYCVKNLPPVDTTTSVPAADLPKAHYTLTVSKAGYNSSSAQDVVVVGGFIGDTIRTTRQNEYYEKTEGFYPYDFGGEIVDVTLTEKESVTPAFDWTPGSAPTGWFRSWGEAGGSTKTVVSTNSAPENLYVVYHDGDGENQKWHPWVNMSSKNSFTLATYGCADMVQASAGKLAVLWCMGSRDGSKILLAKDEQNHIKLLQTSGTTVPTTVIDGGEVSGYHLFTVRFSTETGLSLQIDNGEVKSNATLTTAAAAGFQVGAIYEGIYSTDFERGLGFIVCKMIGYDSADCSATQYAELCATYPAVATMNALAYSTAGGALYLPSLTLASGTLRVKNGVLEVPTGVTASLKSLEFGDQNDPIPTFGMNLAGALTVTANQIFDGNGYTDAYNACNNNNGVNLGEWTGNGTYNITGSFVADGAIVELCHDAASSALNVNGGVFKVKGVTSRYNGRATITLSNNGTINYGQYASATATITKNYGYGTVTGTASWTDTDAITLSDAENGTTFLADGITQTYTGAISGDGKAIINAPNGGKVVFNTFTASAVQVDAGTLELALTNAQLTDGATLLGGATVDVADGAQITLAGADSVSLYMPTIQDDGTLKLVLRQPGADDMATGAVLRIREIMPKGSETNLDPNGLESGWVEVENTSIDKWADLADYCFTRINRSKKLKTNPHGNFPSVLIPPGGRVVFYTSESYPNAAGFVEDGDKCNRFSVPDPDGAVPKFYPEYNNVLVWPDKVNPKKHPFVRLYYAPADGDLEIVDTVVVPSDLPEDASILVGDATAEQSTLRWICTEPTKGAANPSTDGLTRLGPNVGPLYEFEYNGDYKKKYVASEFEMKNFTPPATVGEAYTVTLPINPVMAPTGTTANDNDAISSVKLLYRKGFGNGTPVDGTPIEMTQSTIGDYNWGQLYTATIPADFITAEDKGQLIQWKVEMTDAAGVTWTSPSFHNKDDGYEWYGTIVDPGTYDAETNTAGLNSASLPTWHMFADAASVSQMDKDNPDQDVTVTPNNARVSIYDWSTKTYYDYVRIDLRGNTSANFAKKSHGLRFAKAHPLTMADAVRGGEVEEFRKSSLISEFGDPSWMRQMVAFWLFDKMGNKTPFDFPVRCNLNGAFYQLAFHSERFTDELIEDYYGLDKFGYGYKNVGTLKSGSGTSAGDIEKKTPDDGDEGDISVLENELRKYLKDYGAENDNTTEQPELTKFVVQKFDLPAWLNYIASSKITQEMDDVWANISAYYDSPTMRDGTTRGTGTWMPLAYDFNLSFGQWYYNDASGAHAGLMADEDWFKSHPFYGGNRVRCYKQAAMTEPCNTGNSAYEAIFQSEKFRRLYLRRLRTLMDAELKAPGTPESEVPFMVKMRELAELMRVDSKLDQAKWPNDGTDNAIDVWQATNDRPADIDAGIDEIWEKYVVPRQTHLYVTHGAEYATEESPIGYVSTARAGIPAAQSPIRDLRQGITAEYNATLGAVIIRNTNAEVIDVSNWVLAGPIEMTLPAGTVLDQGTTDAPGEVYVTADRRTTIAAMTLTDQVVVGNGVAGASETAIALTAADGTKVIYVPIEVETTTGEAGITLASPDEIHDCIITLTEEDVEAGMSVEHLVLKLVETVDENGATAYSAVIAITPDRMVVPLPTVELAPAWEVPDAELNPSEGDQTIAIQINNAVKGLWYGYEVTTDLKNTPFAHDVKSFKRATDATIRVKGSPRTDPAAFFRVKVLPAAPTK